MDVKRQPEMALHNVRKDHGYGEAKIARIAEDLPFNVDLLEEILEQEHYIRDFGPAALLSPVLPGDRVFSTATVTINAITATALTGATLTFTPAVESVCEIWPVYDLACVGAGAACIGEVFLDGAALTQPAVLNFAAGQRCTAAAIPSRVTLSAASHTVDLRCKLSAAVGSYSARASGFLYRLTPVGGIVELAQRQQVVVLPDDANGEVAVTFPRPLWWLQGRMEVSVKYGGSVSSANAWRADLLANALADTDIETTLGDVNVSADVAGIGTTGTRKWYPFTTTLPVDRSHQMISVRLRRAGGHANDAYAGDVYIHCLRCRYIPGKHEV